MKSTSRQAAHAAAAAFLVTVLGRSFERATCWSDTSASRQAEAAEKTCPTREKNTVSFCSPLAKKEQET